MARRVKGTKRGEGLPEPAPPDDELGPSGRREPEFAEGDARISPLEEEIRKRAYYRYLEREGEVGDEMSDWLEAEADVLSRHATGIDIDEKVADENPHDGVNSIGPGQRSAGSAPEFRTEQVEESSVGQDPRRGD